MKKVHLLVSELYIYQNARCNNKNYTLQYYSWIPKFQRNILPLSSELKFSVIFSYQNALAAVFQTNIIQFPLHHQTQ